MYNVGFGQVDVTPPVGLRLGRLIKNDVIAGDVKWPLCVRAMAVRDGRESVIIFSLDKGRLLCPAIEELREAVSAATGVPGTHLSIAATHAHNAPFATDWLPETVPGFAYLDTLKEAFAEAAGMALARLQPASMSVGRCAIPGINENRRRVYRTDMGEQVGTHGPTDHPDFLRLEGPVDNELMVLFAEDEAGRMLGGLVNFACHPTAMYSEPVWSADFPGAMSGALEHDPGGIFLFLNGAAGNVSPSEEARRGRHGEELARYIGETLAENVNVCRASKTPLSDLAPRAYERVVRIPQRRPTAKQVELACRYVEDGYDGEPNEFPRDLYGQSYIMYNTGREFQKWYCRELVGMWEWQRRTALREPADDVRIKVIRFAELAIVTFPCEIFSEFGLHVKRVSPFESTMVVEHANGWHGYIPTVEAFSRGGYEATFAYQSHLVPDAGDRMCEVALELLAEAGG